MPKISLASKAWLLSAVSTSLSSRSVPLVQYPSKQPRMEPAKQSGQPGTGVRDSDLERFVYCFRKRLIGWHHRQALCGGGIVLGDDCFLLTSSIHRSTSNSTSWLCSWTLTFPTTWRDCFEGTGWLAVPLLSAFQGTRAALGLGTR